MVQFTNSQQAILRNASGLAVIQTFAGLKRHLNRKIWVGQNNRYRKDCVSRVQADIGSNSLNSAHLAQYVAASGPLHCADGWSFLGRALACIARGDNHSAMHLGYYAELRAAMSLLATQGVGIFNDRHFVLDKRDQCVLLNAGKGKGISTHRMAWAALEFWADGMSVSDHLFEIITPGGIALKNWIHHFGMPDNAIDPVGRKWLKLWGLDLERLANDHIARNEVSYRPTGLSPKPSADARESSSFLTDLWMLCEPSGYSRFETLDRHLLRLSLHDLATGMRIKPADFASRVSNMLDAMGLGASAETEWKPFLTRQRASETTSVIDRAAARKSAVRQEHFGVLSRAFLLLRIATGCCASLLTETGFGREDLQFWWSPIGEDLGFWDSGEQISDLTDLWADIELALEELRDWGGQVESRDESPSYAGWQGSCVQALWALSACERIALWGLRL